MLDIAEGAGRFTQADKRRAFTIARGEALSLAHRLYALLTGLLRVG